MTTLLFFMFCGFPLPKAIAWPLGYAIQDEALYILDGPASQIFVVSLDDGSLVRTIGHRGPGPEELELPDTFWLSEEKTFVFQRARHLLSVFSLDGRFLESHRVSFDGGYPITQKEGRFVSVGGPIQFGKPLLNLWSAAYQWEQGFFEPSPAYRKAEALQDFYVAQGPGTWLFFADPFETRAVTVLDTQTGTATRIPLANPFLLSWDGKGTYDLNTLWTHDRFHAPAPGFYFEAAGTPFLVLNWIRGTAVNDAAFLTEVLDLEEKTPVQFYLEAPLPIGTTDRETVLTIEELETGYFLREIPIRDFLENPEGRAPSP